MRLEFELTEKEEKALLRAAKPTPVMYLSSGMPMFDSPQENANRAWKRLAKKRGFIYESVRPVAGKSQRFFSAEIRVSA